MLDTGQVADDRLGSAAVTESSISPSSRPEDASPSRIRQLYWLAYDYARATILMPQILLHLVVHPRTRPFIRGWRVVDW